jgi:hypothetical protein
VDPLFLAVIEVLNEHGNFYPMAFFSELLIQLRQISREADLLQLFFELSTAAFQGFSLGPAEARAVDELLERCEMIAFTLSVDTSEGPH